MSGTRITVFALQNSPATSIRFLVWTVDGLPLVAVILIALAAALVITGLPFAAQS